MKKRQAKRILRLFKKASKKIVALPIYTQSQVAALHLVYYNEFKELADALGEKIYVKEREGYTEKYFDYRGFKVVWMDISTD